MSKPRSSHSQCQHISPRGQRCRMLCASREEIFCPYHLKQMAASSPDPETLAAELFQDTDSLDTASGINLLLSNVARQFARKRMDRRDALAIGYFAQLLLASLPAIRKETATRQKADNLDALNLYYAKLREQRVSPSRPAAKPAATSAPGPVSPAPPAQPPAISSGAGSEPAPVRT